MFAPVYAPGHRSNSTCLWSGCIIPCLVSEKNNFHFDSLIHRHKCVRKVTSQSGHLLCTYLVLLYRNPQFLYKPSPSTYLYPQTDKPFCWNRFINVKSRSQSSGTKMISCGIFIMPHLLENEKSIRHALLRWFNTLLLRFFHPRFKCFYRLKCLEKRFLLFAV